MVKPHTTHALIEDSNAKSVTFEDIKSPMINPNNPTIDPKISIINTLEGEQLINYYKQIP